MGEIFKLFTRRVRAVALFGKFTAIPFRLIFEHVRCSFSTPLFVTTVCSSEEEEEEEQEQEQEKEQEQEQEQEAEEKEEERERGEDMPTP